MTQLPEIVPPQRVSYGFWHDPQKFLLLLLTGRPNYSADPKYNLAIMAADDFNATGYASEETPGLLLAYAESKYERTLEAFKGVDARREEFTKLSLGLLTGMVTVSGFLKLPVSLPLIVSLASLVVALAVLLLSRKPFLVPVDPNIQAMRESIPHASHPHDWLAAVLHKADRGLQVAIDIRSAQLNVAIWLIAISVLAIVTAILFTRPMPSGSS